MKNFGFGCMRLPMLFGKVGIFGIVDKKQFKKMVDAFMASGFTYFDTAYPYIMGRSETALRECLVKRYKRSEYTVTDKLTENFIHSESDIRPFLDKQLKRVGVDYFDYYLLHAMNEKYYKKFTRLNAFEILKKLKSEGKIKHIGMSFHDRADVLDKILSEHPEIEVVQIQFNYLDYDSSNIQSRAVYDVCLKYDKPIIIMEPCKGGRLANIPDEAKPILDKLGGSYASFAIRFAASFKNVFMVLSGMSNMEQMKDNLSFMVDFKPFTAEEYSAVNSVSRIIKKQSLIPCTACRYCTEGCPQKIPIPEIFGIHNNSEKFSRSNAAAIADKVILKRASACIGCGQCEERCPQKLPVRKMLKDIAKSE